MAGGVRYEIGRDMPMGMQAAAALHRAREIRRILRETYREDENGNRYFSTKWVPLPEATVINEFIGTDMIVVDRAGQKWKDGKPWNV